MNAETKEHFFTGRFQTRQHAAKVVKRTAVIFIVLGIIGCLGSCSKTQQGAAPALITTIIVGLLLLVPAIILKIRFSMACAIFLFALSSFSFAIGVYLILQGLPAAAIMIIFWGILMVALWRSMQAIRFLKNQTGDAL